MEFETELMKRGDLTPRESEVLLLVCNGLSDKMISRSMAVSLNTVSKHLEMIYIKLGVHNQTLNRRVSMLRVALSSGLVRFLCVLLSVSALCQANDMTAAVGRLQAVRVSSSSRRFD